MTSHTRRSFCKALSLPMLWSVAPVLAAEKPLRVALLMSGFEPSYLAPTESVIAGLRELGYVEGRNLVVERRYAELRGDQMLPIAQELAALRPDVIITGCTGSTRAAMRATKDIPIVMASVADPVGQGFVRNLARSGTNITGRSSQSRELMPKMLELLLATTAGRKRIAVLVNKANTVHEPLWSDVEAAAHAMGAAVVRAEVNGLAGLAAGLAGLSEIDADGLLVLPDDPLMFNMRQQVIAVAYRKRIPALYGMREFAVDGGFMSYGESFPESYRRVGTYIDKIARGARASELPIEQPTKFQLVINLRTATELGIAPPRTLQLRADELIR